MADDIARWLDGLGLGRYAQAHGRMTVSLAYSIQGEILAASGDADAAAAEDAFLRAIDVARSQAAKSWELCAATGLARLWRSQGKTTEALDLLAPIYGWFTEGFDTPNLKDAKALLDEIS